MGTAVVDLTFSDDDSDTELLSLQDRIARIKKPNVKPDVVGIVSSTSLKRKILPNDDKLLISDDSNDQFNLPDLKEILGNHHDETKLPNKEELKEEADREILLSKYQPDILGLQFTVNQSEDEFKEKGIEAPKRAKKTYTKKDVDIDKEAAKNERIRLREEKKQEKELAKAIKASEKEMQKSKKPDECLKGMKVLLDHNLIFEKQSEDIFCALDEGNLKYNIEENPINKSIIWCRTILNVTVENNQVVKDEHEELENVLVLRISNESFIKMAHAFLQKSKGISTDEQTLLDHVANIKTMFPQLELTCVVIGLDDYIKSLKESETVSYELKKMAKQVSKTVIEEAMIEVQLQTFVNFNFLNSFRELGDMLVRFSKAIAEAPQRREKQQQKTLAFSWYADADSSCPVKIGRDGSGQIKLWQQQIQQFNNVGHEVAEAIAAKYPSLQILMKAYKSCSSIKEAESLLQDIVVRRNYGPLGTQRRIGPELSYKMYLFFTSTDGNLVLQR